jgi:hypothetical protein
MKETKMAKVAINGRATLALARRRGTPLAALLCASLALVQGCGDSGGGDDDGTGGSDAGTGGSDAGTGGNDAGTSAVSGKGGGGGSPAGSGGAAGTSGASNGGSAQAGTGGKASASCTFEQSSSVSPKIGTVGIVTFSTTLSGIQSAQIDFGLTTSYGMTAPVDLDEPDYRTLLLGMKGSRLYHYRITATNASGACQSPDYTIMTGPIANGLVAPTVTTNDAAALAGGFLITGQYVEDPSGTAPAYIVDSDGDIVWWYTIEERVTGVVMDYAGKNMWINNHPLDLEDAKVHRVSMDGMVDEDLSSQMAMLSHQLTVLPDETVAFYADDGSREQCSDIKEWSPDGTVRTLGNSQEILGTTGLCHLNDIQYSPEDDTLVFSDHVHCAVAKINRSDGSPVWILNGETKTFTGDSWYGSQHGMHILGVDNFLLFTNNSRSVAGTTIDVSNGTGDGSSVIELKLDLDAETVSKVWEYKAEGNAYQTDVMGDVQRLWNGNVIVAFGGKGVIQEVTPDGTVLQEMKTTTNFGYIQKRRTLYGPPPR